MRLLLATTNEGKIGEYKHLLKDSGLEVLAPFDLGIAEKPEETGETFKENAVLKARFYHEKSGLLSLGDDGGLEIEYLGGEPGVKSRRWPGYEAGDEELINIALEKLQGVPQSQRGARFQVVLALALSRADVRTFAASLEGFITETCVRPIIKGYPFRSIFYCPEVGRVLSQCSTEEVHNFHRKRALEQVLPFLQKQQNRN